MIDGLPAGDLQDFLLSIKNFFQNIECIHENLRGKKPL
jgi:hypothetical protein